MSKSITFVVVTTLLFGSALQMVRQKYQSRLLFIELQSVEKILEEYEVEWGKLQLEATMLTAENKVAVVAKDKLQLAIPERDKIIYLQP